jgi:replicative DNA helicase
MDQRTGNDRATRNGRKRDEDHGDRHIQADHSPPYNLDAEQALLGMMMLDAECLHEVIQITAPAEFWRDTHQNLARAIWAQYDAGLPSDPLSVSVVMKREGTFAAIGGDLGLSEMMEKAPAAARAPYLAQIVHAKFTSRRLIEAGNAMAFRGYADATTAEDQVGKAEQSIYEISSGRTQNTVGGISMAMGESMERIEERKAKHAGIGSGWNQLDELTDGWQKGQLIILGARPSMGKTALACGSLRYATEQNHPALLVSLEMTRVEVGERMLMNLSGVPGHKLKRPRLLNYEDVQRLGAACGEAQTLPLWVDDSPSRTPLAIMAAARRIQAKHGLELVIVDYLQLVDADTYRDSRDANRQEQVAQMSRKFKMMARELDIPVLVLSQLNRLAEQRADSRPRMSDLRESGAIEQDADVVLLLHRPEYYNPTDQPGIAEVIVAKNRNGATGTAKLVWRKETCSFADLAQHADPIDDGGPAF